MLLTSAASQRLNLQTKMAKSRVNSQQLFLSANNHVSWLIARIEQLFIQMPSDGLMLFSEVSNTAQIGFQSADASCFAPQGGLNLNQRFESSPSTEHIQTWGSIGYLYSQQCSQEAIAITPSTIDESETFVEEDYQCSHFILQGCADDNVSSYGVSVWQEIILITSNLENHEVCQDRQGCVENQQGENIVQIQRGSWKTAVQHRPR
jgi:hypothetical protein